MELQEIAEQVVQKNLRIGAGDQVLINCWEHTVPMAEALVAACYDVGAQPQVSFFTDNMWRAFAQTPDNVLRQTPSPLLAAYDHFAATIWLGGPKDPAVFEDASPAKMNAWTEGMKPVWDKARERKIRTADINLGQATPERARQYGIDYRAWQDSMTNALGVDPSELSAVGQRVANALRGAKQVRITGPGTDLTVKLAGRHPHVDDGIVADPDLAIGARFIDLPAGSVTVAPDEASADGTITFPFAAVWGKVLPDFVWSFRSGRLTTFSAKENEDVFRAFIDSATGAKDQLGSLSIGINPRAKAVSRGLGESIVEGAAGIALGANKELGGSLESTFMWSATLPAARVEVDGRVVAENGRVVV